MLKKIYVSRKCHNEITMRELTNYRAGLGAKFTTEYVNEDLSKKETFYTRENKHIFKINRASVLASYLIGNGHRGLSQSMSQDLLQLLLKFESRSMNFLESRVLEFRLENTKPAGERARCLLQKEYGFDPTMNLI